MLKLGLSIFFSFSPLLILCSIFEKAQKKGMFTTAEKRELEFMLCLGYP